MPRFGRKLTIAELQTITKVARLYQTSAGLDHAAELQVIIKIAKKYGVRAGLDHAEELRNIIEVVRRHGTDKKNHAAEVRTIIRKSALRMSTLRTSLVVGATTTFKCGRM